MRSLQYNAAIILMDWMSDDMEQAVLFTGSFSNYTEFLPNDVAKAQLCFDGAQDTISALHNEQTEAEVAQFLIGAVHDFKQLLQDGSALHSNLFFASKSKLKRFLKRPAGPRIFGGAIS